MESPREPRYPPPMTRTGILGFGTIIVLAGSLASAVPAQEGGTRPRFGREFLARLRGLDQSRVGTWLDVDFRPLDRAIGIDQVRREPYPSEASPRFEARYEHVESTDVARAHASVWGLGSGDFTEEGARQHASWRALQTVGVFSIEVNEIRTPPPPDARFVVSAVHVGRMLELHFRGDSSALHAGVSALFPSGEIAIEERRAVSVTSFDVLMLGLRPQGPVVPITAGPSSFVADESPAVPILAELTPLRTSSALLVRVSRVEFIGVGDGSGSAEIMVSARQGAEPLLPWRRGPQDSNTWAVPSDVGALAHPVTVTATAPLHFQFREDDAFSDDEVGGYELSELYPQSEPQCFGGAGDPQLTRVRFCLVVVTAPPTGFSEQW
jgi:hypothetical protein